MYMMNQLKQKKHLQSIIKNEYDECIKTKHTIENPDFFDIDELFND